MGKRGRGRPRKIKKLEQYTISELRDMPMGSMVRLFLGDLTGRKTIVATPVAKPEIIFTAPKKKKEKRIEVPTKVSLPAQIDNTMKMESTVVADLMGMTLEKKADYLADALMRYLKKAK